MISKRPLRPASMSGYFIALITSQTISIKTTVKNGVDMLGSTLINRIKTILNDPIIGLYHVYFKLGIMPTKKIKNKALASIPVYCINLPSAKERRAFMLEQVDRTEFSNFQFIEGINGAELDVEGLTRDGLYDDATARKYHGRPLRLGEIALSLSHGKIYDQVVANNQKMALILEDDAIFVTNRINSIDVASLPANWDIIFLSSALSHYPPNGKIKGNLYNTESWRASAAAYLVSLSGAAKLASTYKPTCHAADGFIGRNIDYPDNKAHDFKQVGARCKLNASLVYPDCMLNGSCLGFSASTIR